MYVQCQRLITNPIYTLYIQDCTSYVKDIGKGTTKLVLAGFGRLLVSTMYLGWDLIRGYRFSMGLIVVKYFVWLQKDIHM